MYGVEELKEHIKNRVRKGFFTESLQPENKLSQLNEKESIEFVKKKALDLEATVFHHFHKGKPQREVDSKYSSKIRILLMNMKNEINFELRHKIITG